MDPPPRAARIPRPERRGRRAGQCACGCAPASPPVTDASVAHARLGRVAADLAVQAERGQPRDLALALDARRVIGRQAADELGDAVAQLQREVRRRRAHELADVVERDLVVGAQAVGMLGLAHGVGGASGVRTGTISSSASMRACCATEIAFEFPMIQP